MGHVDGAAPIGVMRKFAPGVIVRFALFAEEIHLYLACAADLLRLAGLPEVADVVGGPVGHVIAFAVHGAAKATRRGRHTKRGSARRGRHRYRARHGA